MTITALVIPATSAPFTVELPKSDPAAALRTLVGGWLEGVYGTTRAGEPVTLYVNEDGKGRGLPANATATLLWRYLNQGTVIADELVGTTVVLGASGCAEADIPADALHAALALHRALSEVPLNQQ
ncbi:DUF3846 domain-containing protein [Mycolicibacterium porcinum]|uniref:DUF3846 domain-containing protein n=1 Tax=Mycolicibacterium porcinum TaxID=39693 RepID=A0ABV3V6M5_9MYCO